MAATYISTAGDQFIFDITYNDVDTGELKNISCVTLDSTYHARVNYKNLQQTVTVNITEGKPLNASILTQKSLFVDVLNSVPTADGFAYNPEYNYNNFTFEQLFEIYHATQVRTMRDTFVRAITGAISSFGKSYCFRARAKAYTIQVQRITSRPIPLFKKRSLPNPRMTQRTILLQTSTSIYRPRSSKTS